MLYLYMNQTLVSIFETQGSKFLNFYQKYLRIESLDNEYISNCSFHKVTFTNCSFEAPSSKSIFSVSASTSPEG